MLTSVLVYETVVMSLNKRTNDEQVRMCVGSDL